MARRKAKVYSRFSVGTYMQEKKRLRNENALTHKTLAKEKAKLSRLIYRVSNNWYYVLPFILGCAE